jgi:hypothetical protein
LGTPDQRGVVRTGGVNIGAYQASAGGLVLLAPATVTSGTPFDITVQVVDIYGQVVVGFTGTVSFAASDPDPGVVLPPSYQFTAGDQGTHTFSAGATLITIGTTDLQVSDAADGLSTDVNIQVTG